MTDSKTVASPQGPAEALVKRLTWCAGFCEMVAHDGIMPSRQWFAENAPAMREAAALLVRPAIAEDEDQPACVACEVESVTQSTYGRTHTCK